MKASYDFVIIGSGAGGAPIAHTLARHPKGHSVLVLEKGPLLRPQNEDERGLSDFKRDELFATGPEKRIRVPDVANQGQSYYSSHVEPDLNDEPHVYRDVRRDGGGLRQEDRATLEGYTAQVVGGGTQLYGGVSLRFTPTDMALRSFNEGRTDIRDDPEGDAVREARDWPVTYDELEPYYCRAERLVGISGSRDNQAKPFSEVNYQKPVEPNPISHFVEAGMDALGMPRYRTPLAVITEDHAPSGRQAGKPKTGFVNRYGDPLGFKSNTWVSLLAPTMARFPNLELRANCTVTHLEAQGAKVTRVRFRDEAGRETSVDAKYVVVACSAIESVRLLLLSAREDAVFEKRLFPNKKNGVRKELVGKYFLTHCFGGAETVMPGRFDKSLSLDSDWATDFCNTPDFLRANGLWAGGAIYNNTSAHALPISVARTYGNQDIDTIWKAFVENTQLTGEKLVTEVFDRDFGRQLSVSFMANQIPLSTNRIELHPKITDKWGRKVAYIIKEWHRHDQYLMNTLADQCRRILAFGGNSAGNYPVDGFGGVYMAENGLSRIANHILGGARFGSDPDDSVLDRNCKVWDFDNLFVTDGSFMPTSGGGNPTLTIQANAFRVGDHLASL